MKIAQVQSIPDYPGSYWLMCFVLSPFIVDVTQSRAEDRTDLGSSQLTSHVLSYEPFVSQLELDGVKECELETAVFLKMPIRNSTFILH